MKAGDLIERYDVAQVLILLVVLCLFPILVSGCGPEELEPKEGEMALTVLSSAFQEGEKIPSKYSCQGEDISPPPLVCQVSL
jgi:hypothetical protein